MKNKNTIEQLKAFRHCLLYYLEYNIWEYEHLKWEYFEQWCERVNGKKRIVENLLDLKLNDHLLNWFDAQWERYVEKETEQYYGEALQKGVFNREEVQLMIELAIEDIYRIYPKTLLQQIAKHKTKNKTL